MRCAPEIPYAFVPMRGIISEEGSAFHGCARIALNKATVAYQDFLTLWKDADPDVPIFIAAKSEYANLK